jgi:hypothetical protein
MMSIMMTKLLAKQCRSWFDPVIQLISFFSFTMLVANLGVKDFTFIFLSASISSRF